MTHKLLLADDSVTIQRVVELTFSGEDVQVVTVGDGEQAIARIPSELPDIVLADIGMPKRSGYEVSAFVKGRPDLAHIPVLLLAGAFEPVDEAKARDAHSDGVLVKPFEPQQVISRVKDLIAASRTAAASPAPEPSMMAEEPPAPPVAYSAVPEPPAPLAEPSPSAMRAEPGLDDYFDRLDEAFAKLSTGPSRPGPAAAVAHEEPEPAYVPTVEQVLATPTPAVGSQAVTPGSEVSHAGSTPVDETSGPPRNLVADMFAALFALEQGETTGSPLERPVSRAETPQVSDALVDELTRRVLARLAPDAVDGLVAQIVSEVAERLVREEIARIKTAAAARL